MGSLNRFNLERLVATHQVTHLVETGYGEGASCQAALRAGFKQVISCEIFEPLHAKVVQSDQLRVLFLNSVSFLQTPEVLQFLGGHRSMVFLDAHYPGADHGGQSYLDTTRPAQQRLPLISELEELRGKAGNSLLVLDDVRIYRKEFKVALGPNPDWAENAWNQEARFVSLLESFGSTHSLHWLAEDTGYAVLWPLAWGAYELQAWVLAGDQNNPHDLQIGVPGTTCLSLNRRLQDARFGNRWLVGRGIDVGAGPDSISLYRALFPQIQSVTVYDWAQGDAQYLSNVPTASFDFVHSGHCLEHMVDPRIALANWLRVLRVGGYLVLTIPDEDLYEQGVWPSTFNTDHKHSFTIFKRKSWSPVSINVLGLLQNLDADISIEKIEQLNHSFLTGYVRFDKTRTAFAECGIEIVLRKC